MPSAISAVPHPASPETKPPAGPPNSRTAYVAASTPYCPLSWRRVVGHRLHDAAGGYYRGCRQNNKRKRPDESIAENIPGLSRRLVGGMGLEENASADEQGWPPPGDADLY